MYILRFVAQIEWIGDGAGPQSVPSAQKLQLGTLQFSDLTTRYPGGIAAGQPTGYLVVPGGDAPTQGNFNTAISGAAGTPTAPSMANDLAVNGIAPNLARILTFATGGG